MVSDAFDAAIAWSSLSTVLFSLTEDRGEIFGEPRPIWPVIIALISLARPSDSSKGLASILSTSTAPGTLGRSGCGRGETDNGVCRDRIASFDIGVRDRGTSALSLGWGLTGIDGRALWIGAATLDVPRSDIELCPFVSTFVGTIPLAVVDPVKGIDLRKADE